MIEKTLEDELQLKNWQVRRVIELIDEGSTIPFIARYRKDVTGSLNDETLRKFDERLKYLRNLEKKKLNYIKHIKDLGKLTKDLENKILAAETLVELDDLYRPFKSKKQTRATIAKDNGLEPLAKTILKQEIHVPVSKIAKKYLNENVKTVEDAIKGASDIIAEIISDNSDFRKKIRKDFIKYGVIHSKAKTSDESEYELYYNYSEKVSKIPPHRLLAINRGENEGILKVKIEIAPDKILRFLNGRVIKDNPYTGKIIKEAIEDSYKRLISPSIEREVRKYLTERSEKQSIEVFSKNLYQLLMESPLVDKTILGWDPGFKNGCKLAVIDETGKVLETSLIHLTENRNKIRKIIKTLRELIDSYGIDVIAIGNGTASRESEKVVSEIIKNSDVEYVVVNEAGASVYSASELASEEFPDLNEGERSAVSIARRLQDPLAELVKIDPKSIGVGQYQHDMNQKYLNESLTGVVESVVNKVGVDLNTASSSLLNYISGISKSTAKNIISYREENGSFSSREELKQVKGLGNKTFEQCAGFVKIDNGDNPLDQTTIHPESYRTCEKLLKSLDIGLKDIGNSDLKLDQIDYEKLAQELDIGVITLRDIVGELKKPGRDPRLELEKPQLRKNILTIDDLEEDMVLQGTVRNIVDFGAFVDIGIHQDGLVHISQLANKFVKHPLDIVSVGDIVDVKVIDIDTSKNRIQLSMKI
ncbi:Tex family protein [uncultured Methanobrevibacter sp.]|uniref:Tex family protein n=1 Tax=uncultured Methanobrevibacter sp. TaxID=253161 RepID=UPI0026E0B988|nr:Tex family protein [uncultured Methanobrevibacter sp.]